MADTNAFLTNVIQYNAELEAARAKEDKKRKDKVQSDVSAKDRMKSQKERDFDIFMKSVADYEKRTEFRQAIGYIDRMGKKHPDYAGRIATRRAELIVKMEQKEGGIWQGGADAPQVAPHVDPTDGTSQDSSELDETEDPDEQDPDEPLQDDTGECDPFASAPLIED